MQPPSYDEIIDLPIYKNIAPKAKVIKTDEIDYYHGLLIYKVKITNVPYNISAKIIGMYIDNNGEQLLVFAPCTLKRLGESFYDIKKYFDMDVMGSPALGQFIQTTDTHLEYKKVEISLNN
jgi:hypothetical protein